MGFPSFRWRLPTAAKAIKSRKNSFAGSSIRERLRLEALCVDPLESVLGRIATARLACAAAGISALSKIAGAASFGPMLSKGELRTAWLL